MRNGMFVPATQCKSHPNVKSDGKARFDTGKPTLTQQGIATWTSSSTTTTRSSKT